MGDVIEYSDIHQEIRGCMNPGRLKLQSGSIIFKNIKTGKVDQLNASDVESAQWLTRARGYCLKVILTNETIHRFDGLKEAEYDRLAPFFEKHYDTKLEQVNMSLKGWNWGLSRFTANALDFEVDGKTAFEIPLGNVSHSLTSKNEVTVEFHPNDDAPVSLMELRFHIPAGAADNEQDPVQDFYHNVIAKADIIQATGDAIVILQEIQCLTPRGRYDIKIYQTFIQLHGKTFDYKIPHTTILRLFLLPHRDGRQMFFVISLDPPIKQGMTRYPFLILLFNIEDEITLSLGLTDEEITEKYEKKIEKEMEGLEYEVVSRIMKTIVSRKITTTGSFKGASGIPSIACSYKAATGFLYPLDRGFIFIYKPAMHIRFDEISSVNFARGSGSTTRSFDFEIETKANTTFIFVGIEKDEYGRLYDHVMQKKLRVKNIGGKGMKKGLYNEDMDGSDNEGNVLDPYLERMKAEGKDRNEDDLDDDTDSSDESFNPGESGSEVAEEYDTDAGSSSSSSEEDSNEDEEARKQRKDARRAEKEAEKAKVVKERKPRGPNKKRTKKNKDPNKPTRPTTAFMSWLNDTREEMKSKFPGISVTEIAKKGGEMWRELKDKTKWEEKANEARERYKVAMEEYNARPHDEDDEEEDEDSKASPKGRKKKSGGSPRKAKAPVGDTKGGSGAGYKSKEFIESSGSENDSEASGKPKKKKMKTEPRAESKSDGSDDSEDDEYQGGSGSESGSDGEKKPKGRRTSKRGKPGGEIKEEAEEFAGLPSDEEILASGSGSDEGPPSPPGSGSAKSGESDVDN